MKRLKNNSLSVVLCAMMLIYGCDQNADDKVMQIPTVYSTWELIEVKIEDSAWRPVTSREKYSLRFLDNNNIEYSAFENTCMGQYSIETNDTGLITLSENINCAVPDNHMWITEQIMEYEKDIVITTPRLNPTAVKSYLMNKYRVVESSTQE